MSLRAPRRLVAAAAVPALLAGVAIAAPANAAPAAEQPKYKGAAFALQTKLGIGGETLLDLQLPDAVVFPAGGDKTLIDVPKELSDLVKLKVLNASAGLEGLKFAANSSTTGLSLLQGLVGAKVLDADCLADKLDVQGQSLIAGLELGGTKIPVDTDSPNVKIEIPKELSAFLVGTITIDEQNLLPGGGMQIRALHVDLAIAPDALGAALKAVNETVRAVAKQLVAVVEEATGQSLSSLLAQTNGAAPHGGAQADRSVRSQAVATKTAKAEKATVARKAAKETSAHRAFVAQQEAASTAATEQADTAEQTSVSKADAKTSEVARQSAADNTGLAKTDEASVARQSAAEQASTEAAMARRAERGAKPAEASATTEQQQTDEAAAAARAENGAAQGQAEQAQVEQAPAASGAAERAERTNRALAAEGAAKAEQKAAAAKRAEADRAERTASHKSDGADLRTSDRTTARAAAPKAKEATGLIDLEVIVSEVNCTGAKLAVASPPKRELPNTGGADMAGDFAVGGLGLLLAGSAVAFATRRRRQH